MLIYLPVHLHLQKEQFSAFLTLTVSLLTVARRAASVQNSLSDVVAKDTSDTFLIMYFIIVKAGKADETAGISFAICFFTDTLSCETGCKDFHVTR